jgi:glycosyltransferase involved in cell wall biosynthesis
MCLAGPFGNTGQAQRVITGKSYQFMAAGMPTVIGKNQAGKPFFKDKLDCLLVDQGDAEALSKVITWAYKNRTKLPAIGKNGRILYEKKFSNAVIAKSLRQLLDELGEPVNS